MRIKAGAEDEEYFTILSIVADNIVAFADLLRQRRTEGHSLPSIWIWKLGF